MAAHGNDGYSSIDAIIVENAARCDLYNRIQEISTQGNAMPVPLEFHVLGRPASANGSSARKQDWKAVIDNAVQHALVLKLGASKCAKYVHDVTAKIFYFPHNGTYTDVDNGLKYTIDGLALSLLENDKRVVRIVAERFPCQPGASLIVPPALAVTLIRAIDAARPRTKAEKKAGSKSQYATAVKIEDYRCNGGSHW